MRRQLSLSVLLGVVACIVAVVGCGPTEQMPVANEDVIYLFEDGEAFFDPLANDVDPEGGTLAIEHVFQPQHGTVTFFNQTVLQYVPDPDFFGYDSFQYEIRNGLGATATGTVNAHVMDVNDPPSFVSGGDVTADEDAGPCVFSAWASAISPGPNESGWQLSFTTTDISAPELFAMPPLVDAVTGDLIFEPAPDVHGEAAVTVVLGDGSVSDGLSAPVSFLITILPVNDPPSFTWGSDVIVDEDCGPQLIAAWASDIVAGPADEAEGVTFTILDNSNPFLFAEGPALDAATGDLTFTPVDDGFGVAVLLVTLVDDQGVESLAPALLSIEVCPVNDPPAFVAGADVVVDEDCGTQAVAAWATDITPGPFESQDMTFAILDNTNPGLFAAGPAVDAGGGELTFEPASDAYGTAAITIVLQDDGASDNESATATFTITINAVNDPPTFTPGGDIIVDEDALAQTFGAWASDISSGPMEAPQVLAFTLVDCSDPSLFAALPAVDALTGDVTFEPAADAFGSADVTIDLSDDGAVDNVGAPVTFTIIVAAVNDAPRFVPGSDIVVDEDAGPQVVGAWAGAISAGPGEDAQALAFAVLDNTNPGLFSVLPLVDALTGDVAFQSASDAHGAADVTIVLIDDGGLDDTSVPATFTITVNSVHDLPVAADDLANTAYNTPAVIDVLANDYYDGAGPPTVGLVAPAANGTASVLADGSVQYQPNAGFSGVERLSYVLTDSEGEISGATITLGVRAPFNAPPVAADDAYATDIDTPLSSMQVLGNDTDANFDALAIIAFTQPAGGVVTLNADGTLFYTPPHDVADAPGGWDSFQYVVSDGSGVDTATVTVAVSDAAGTLEERHDALVRKCHAQMRQVGAAIGKYRVDHDQAGEAYLPPRLRDLVTLGYLPSDKLLVCPLDHTHGAEGGRPDSVVNQYAELDEPGVSYCYEMSGAEVSWDWISFIDPPVPFTGPQDLPDRDGIPFIATWGEVKLAQLIYGDVYLHDVVAGGYPPSMFPIVRCFWHTDDPDSNDPTAISNLSFEYGIFLSGAQWERDVVDALTGP
jgi:hypothetical protein